MTQDAALLGTACADGSQRQVAERLVSAPVEPIQLALVSLRTDRHAAVDQRLRNLGPALVELRLQLPAAELEGGALQGAPGQVVAEQR